MYTIKINVLASGKLQRVPRNNKNKQFKQDPRQYSRERNTITNTKTHTTYLRHFKTFN